MENEERYAVGSVSSGSGSLHFWLRHDGASRRAHTNCRPEGPGAVASSLHCGHLFVASASASGSSSHICAHALSRVSGGPSSRSAAPEPSLSAVAIAHKSGLLAGAGASGRCYLWSLASGDLLASWDAHFRKAARISFTDDEETLVTAGADASVLAFDVAELVDCTRRQGDIVKPRVSMRGHDLPIVALAVGFGGASARVVSASADRTAKLWHLSSGRCIGTVMLSAPATDVALSPDESRFYVGLESGAIVAAPPTRLSQVTPVADSSLVVFTAPGQSAQSQPSVTALATSPCGSEIVAGYGDGRVRILDAESGVELIQFAKHGDVPITWVGTFFPIPEAILRDAGGQSQVLNGGKESVSSEQYFGDSKHSHEPANLLFQGALRKAVDVGLEGTFLPCVVLAGADSPSAAWEAVDRTVALLPANRP